MILFHALMALILVAGCALVATVTTLALRGATGGTRSALSLSLVLMGGLFLALSGGEPALPAIAVLAHGVAAAVLWWRGRGAAR